jgi:deoxyhypusine synthase
VDAAKGYVAHLDKGGKMMITLGGAMSTAELGLSLAEMIRQDKVQLITCTGANLEEDVFNLVAHDYYERVPHYRIAHAEDEQALLERHMNRVTDTCIPEGEAMRRMEKAMLEVWTDADKKGERYFPHEFFYKVLLSGKYEKYYQIDPKDSWMLAAAKKNLPIVVPGWEDATLGNMYAAAVIRGDVKNVHTVRTGIEYMTWLAEFYTRPPPRRARSACSRSAAAFPAISRSASCRCCIRICCAPACRSGATSARSAIRPRATAAIPAPCRTKKSPGASSA